MSSVKINSDCNTSKSNFLHEFRSHLEKKLPEINSKLSDSILLRSLMLGNFNLVESVELLKNYIQLRRKHQEFFLKSLEEKELENIFEYSYTGFPFPQDDCVIVCKVSQWNPDEYTALSMCKAVLLAMECMSLDMDIIKNGIIFVIDAKSVGWKQIKALTPSMLQSYFKIINNSPINLKLIIVYNINWATDFLYKLINPVLPRRIAERIVLVSDPSKLKDYLNENVLKKLEPSLEDKKAFKSIVEKKSIEVFESWAKLDQCTIIS